MGYRLSEAEGAGWSGLSTCGSVWTCAVCASKVLSRRSDELAELLERAKARGCSVGMVTLTMRHRAGQPLRALWGAANKGWSRVTSGKQWVADQAKFEVFGWIRAVEVTFGEHGWHVHVHALVLFEGPMSEAMGEELGRRMWKRWDRGLAAKGMDSLRDSGGLDYRASWSSASSWAADYLAKATADEAVFGPLKNGRNGNRAPFRVLADVFEHGDADDLATWHEWERVAPGHKMITYSGGLRSELGIEEAEATDEELAEEDAGTEDRLWLPREAWRAVRDTPAVWSLLSLGELAGIAAVRSWLDAHGHPYVLSLTPD